MTSSLNSVPGPRSLNLLGVDLAAVKARQQATWASADFSLIGSTLQLVGENLCEAAELEAGARVLDVACGNGNAALAAARRFCQVVGLDYVPTVIARARERAAAERLAVDFVTGDAEQLPFPAESFDAALSSFGVMFAPDQERTARELTRVVKRGGKIALANWTPEGFVGRLLVTVGKHAPPPAGVASPAYWGNETRLRELFSDVTRLRAVRRDFVFRYESFQHFIDVFRDHYGPIRKAFAALDEQAQGYLLEDLRKLADEFKSPTHGSSLAIPGEYLEVVIHR